MKYDVLNRYTGAVQFTAEIDCKDNAPRSLKLRLAVLWAVKNNVSLVGANLAGANLAGANLVVADLVGADLAVANLIDGGQDARGYRFWAWRRDDGAVIVRGGCREWAGIDAARAHYGADYAGAGDRAECVARIALIEIVARANGWVS